MTIHEQGPRFDFEALQVKEKEESLRRIVLKFKAKFEKPLSHRSVGEKYQSLLHSIRESLPALFAAYDAYVESVLETSDRKVRCGGGCAHCCAHYVSSVEPFELLLLHDLIRRREDYGSYLVAFHRRVRLFEELLGDAGGNEAAEDVALYRYYLKNQPCPLLTPEGNCGVYEHRPMSCRMFFSMSAPRLCKGSLIATAANKNFIIELPVDIEADLGRISNAFAALSLPGELFAGLLRVNELFGRFDGGESVKAD